MMIADTAIGQYLYIIRDVVNSIDWYLNDGLDCFNPQLGLTCDCTLVIRKQSPTLVLVQMHTFKKLILISSTTKIGITLWVLTWNLKPRWSWKDPICCWSWTIANILQLNNNLVTLNHTLVLISILVKWQSKSIWPLAHCLAHNHFTVIW